MVTPFHAVKRLSPLLAVVVGPVTLGYVPGEVFGYVVPRAAAGVN